MLDRSRWIALILGSLAPLGCTSASPPPPPVVAAPAPPPGPDPARYHVLMINGGGSPAINYQSHLVHLKELRALLLASGVRAGQIAILSSDGDDPAPDLVTREAQPEPDFWRLASTRVGRRLDTPITPISSSIEGVHLIQATKASVGRWFADEGKRLAAGDILLLYVTDHGTRPTPEPLDNRITLWGKDETLNVRELSTMVSGLPAGVRTVMLMSQCYSGGFAGVAWGKEQDPPGNVCGYFSSTADRPAYGCFAENKGKDGVGHSFHFTRALAAAGRFVPAHEAVLSADVSPDVPLRSSDLYLEEVLGKSAAERSKPLAEVADEALREAFKDPAGGWEPEIRLLDRIAQAFGTASPRTLTELAAQSQEMPTVNTELATFERAWGSALADASSGTFERFVRANESWSARLTEPSLAALAPADARALTRSLIAELAPYSKGLVPEGAQLDQLHARSEATQALAYRMAVRLGAALRMRTVLTSIAGRAYLAHHGTAAQKKAHEALVACEDLTLPKRLDPPPAPLVESAPYPPFADDLKLSREILPAWAGLTFAEAGAEIRQKQKLEAGAAVVNLVYPDSPAKAAGLQPADIVIGPPGLPFTAKNQLRTFTMLSAIDQPAPLEVLRDNQRIVLNLVPGAYPMKWPALPGPPAVGSAAPALDLKSYRGTLARSIAPGSAHLLYFWATWCGPCKAALPEVLAFEKERKIPVVAITDEDAPLLDTFFKGWKTPFPRTVAMDPRRGSFVSYGVSGTPTFVLIDEKGRVLHHQTGYAAGKGLEVPGWSFAGRGGGTGKGR